MAELRELLSLLGQLYSTVSVLHRNHPAARAIQFPKIPPILSESICCWLLNRGKVLPNLVRNGYQFELGHSADILGQKDKANLRIEVKSTARSAFQELSEKDIRADYLIWLHFSNSFLDWSACEKRGYLNIEVYPVKTPFNYFKQRQKITLSRFKQVAAFTKAVNVKFRL